MDMSCMMSQDLTQLPLQPSSSLVQDKGIIWSVLNQASTLRAGPPWDSFGCTDFAFFSPSPQQLLEVLLSLFCLHAFPLTKTTTGTSFFLQLWWTWQIKNHSKSVHFYCYYFLCPGEASKPKLPPSHINEHQTFFKNPFGVLYTMGKVTNFFFDKTGIQAYLWGMTDKIWGMLNFNKPIRVLAAWSAQFGLSSSDPGS